MTRPASLAAAAYLALALVFTWPLASVFGSAIAGSLDRPLLAIWAMTTISNKVTQGLTGDPTVLATFWDGNILHPQPKALLYSEPFLGQSLLTLPLWWLTKNVFVVYNAAVLASVVLTAFASFLLARAFGAGTIGAFVAGLLAAFSFVGLADIRALDALSIYWLPFTMLAWHRYVERGTWRGLALAVVCAWLLNISSSGYLWTCAPILLVFAVLDLVLLDRRRQLDRWLGLAIAIPAVALLSAPVILPVLDMQRQGLLQRPGETIGGMLGEGIGAVSVGGVLDVGVIALAAMAIVGAIRRRTFVPARYVWLTLALAFLTVALGLTSKAAWSVYPYVTYGGNRSFAVLSFLTALLAGFGVPWLLEMRRLGAAIVTIAVASSLIVSWPGATPINAPTVSEPLLSPAPYLEPSSALPPIYRSVQSLNAEAVVIELPFGNVAYDARYTFFAALHGRRLMNGFTDASPPSWLLRRRVLLNPLLDPESSARALGGATHIVVHGNAWPDDTGVKIAHWLETLGARPIAAGDGAGLYQLEAPERLASLR